MFSTLSAVAKVDGGGGAGGGEGHEVDRTLEVKSSVLPMTVKRQTHTEGLVPHLPLYAQPTLSLLLHTSWVNWPHLLLATPGSSSSMSGSPPK